MADSKAFAVGTRVEVSGKGIVGTVAFIGTTHFSTGKWVGVVLDEATGKNNGSVQGKIYFKCADNCGIFVRQSQIVALDDGNNNTADNVTDDGTSGLIQLDEAPAPKRRSAAASAGTKPAKSPTAPPSGKTASSKSGTVPSKSGASASKPTQSVPKAEKPKAAQPKAAPPQPAPAPVPVQPDPVVTAPAVDPVPAVEGLPTSSKLQTPSSTTGVPRRASMPPPRTASMEDLKKSNRKSLSGLKPPSALSSNVGRSTESLTSKSMKLPTPASTPTESKPVPAIVVSKKPAPATTSTENLSGSLSPVEALSKTTAASSDPHGTAVDHAELQEKDTEITNLRAEVTDLEEKLETLKQKRGEDKVKLKQYEKAKIQMQALQEYKIKAQENHTDMVKQLQAAKKECQDVQEAYNRYKDDMSELSETIEISALDKEMAEEKAETLQLEIDQLKEQNEELSLDLQILQEEVNSEGTDGAATNFQVKQLEQQNERIKEALVKMRDLSNEEKQEIQQQQKQLEKQTSQISNLTKDKQKLNNEVETLQGQVIELTEQVDCAQGAEEMVEQLTEKTLEQEEKIQELEDEKNDLEALCEMNDELQENSRETELELREEVDMNKQRLVESQRRLEAVQESVTDYENTISKFRDLVTQLQESNRDMRSKQEVSTTMVKETPTIELFDFNAKFAETKAHAKAIDMEMRKLDVEQANKHVKILCSFMPESFLKRGGDHDAVLVLLLIPRVMAKVELLIAQIKEKYNVPEQLEKGDVMRTHVGEAYSFAKNFIYQLCILLGCMKQYESALDTCDVKLLLKIGTLIPELSAQEKTLDGFVEMLRKDLLDENISLEPVYKIIVYYQTLYSVHLNHMKKDCTTFMSDHTRILLAACDCMGLDINILKLAILPGQETSDVSILLRDLENVSNDIKVACRKIKRRIPQKDSAGKVTPLSFGEEIEGDLVNSVQYVENVVKALQQSSKAAMEQATLLTETLSEDADLNCQGLQSSDIKGMTHDAANKIYNHDNRGPETCLRDAINNSCVVMKKISTAMENGEYDFDGTASKKTQQPIVLRAQSVKAQLSDVGNIKNKLEMKEEDILELRKAVKIKQEELSEQQVRMRMMEKKLETAGKDGDDRATKIQCKLDEVNMTLKKKDTEYEVTLDALQNDIDTLEMEKLELKDRLKSLSKKTLLEGLHSRQNSQSGPTLSDKDSAAMTQRVDSLKEALTHVKEENTRLIAQTTMNKLNSLPPLVVPKLPAPDNDITKLSRETSKLLKELYTLSASPRIVDVTKHRPGVVPATDSTSPRNQLIQSAANLARLKKTTNDLQVKVTSLLAANRPGGQVRTDFSTFPTPAFAKVLHEKASDSVLVASISIPVPKGTKGSTIPVHVTTEQLKTIHNIFVS